MTAIRPLLERTLVDMGITTSIEKVKMIIRPAEPLFIISIRTRKAGGSRMVSEIATIEEKEGGTFLAINDENFAPRLLSLLWRTFGRESIEQVTRLEVLAKGTDRQGHRVTEAGSRRGAEEEVAGCGLEDTCQRVSRSGTRWRLKRP